jgi:hypothetical protein
MLDAISPGASAERRAFLPYKGTAARGANYARSHKSKAAQFYRRSLFCARCLPLFSARAPKERRENARGAAASALPKTGKRVTWLGVTEGANCDGRAESRRHHPDCNAAAVLCALHPLST